MVTSTPKFEHWLEWKRVCAIEKCGDATASSLGDFARSRLSKYLHTYGGDNLIPEYAPMHSPKRSFMNLEASMAETWVAGQRLREDRKTYKDWLFDRLKQCKGTPSGIVESGASGRIRTLAREIVSGEGLGLRTKDGKQRKGLESLGAKRGDVDGGGCSLEDLLPGVALDPSQESFVRELEELSEAAAVEFFEMMPFEKRAVLCAKALGVPFYHDEVSKLVGKAKSQTSEMYRNLLGVKRLQDYTAFDESLGRPRYSETKSKKSETRNEQGQLADWLAVRFKDEDEFFRKVVLLRVVEKLRENVKKWASAPENEARILFSLVEKGNDQ
ncbi:MAG: hypothetical protein HN406_09730 [Lentisphaerae bacterium]|nr:hypothetical protein [Lentisphaerota bacterium]